MLKTLEYAIVYNKLYLFLVGGLTKSPVDGIKSRSLPGVIYQQEDVGRGIKNRSHLRGGGFRPFNFENTISTYGLGVMNWTCNNNFRVV